MTKDGFDVPEPLKIGPHELFVESDYGPNLGARVILFSGPVQLPMSSDEARSLSNRLKLAAAHADHLAHGDKQKSLFRS